MMDEAFDGPDGSGATNFTGYPPLVIDDPLARAIAHYNRSMSLLDEEEEAIVLEAAKRQETAMPSSFLDAMVEAIEKHSEKDTLQISAVNSDEAGLYRMFVNISP